MPRRCGLGCTPTRGVLHVFPNPDKFPEQFKAWVRVVSHQDECNFDYKKMRICDKHFTEKDRNRNNRLNVLAVPSLFLHEHLVQTPNKPSVSTSSMPILKTYNQISDNNYQSSSAMPHHCAFGCKNTGVKVHVFPNPEKYPERFKAWVDLFGGKLETSPDYMSYRKKRICDIHFIDKHRNRFGRLNALAVPSLNIPSKYVKKFLKDASYFIFK